MVASKMPTADVDVTIGLVRELLAAQHPDLAELGLRELANGWDNVLFRLGDDLTVRLPRRAEAAVLVQHEQAWLPRLAPRLPVPVPVPLRVGRPGEGYPWAWSILPWLDGETIGAAPVTDKTRLARDLGQFLGALHTPAPPDAPINPHRAGPLADRSAVTMKRIEELKAVVSDAGKIARRWLAAVTLDEWCGPAMWAHGDLHPLNLLQRDDRLAAVLDFGDVTSGDPANDLSVAWMLFDAGDREVFRAAAATPVRPIDDTTWERARAWALSTAVLFLQASADNPALHRVGEFTLAAVLADYAD